jgi:hypothetical protein
MLETVENILDSLDGISLSNMDDVALQKRTDTKFILSHDKLPAVLHRLKDSYQALEINGQRLMKYKSLYFDTPDYKFYHDHHNGKIKRTKIRMRQYVDSDLYFLEVKMKDGRSNTRKKRMPIPGFEDISSPIYQMFMEDVTNKKYDLSPSLWNNFQRMTLVNKDDRERVTLDVNLSFEHEGKKRAISNLAIIELKQARPNRNSAVVQALKQEGVNPFGFSKYCIGMTQLYDDIKYNAFKPKLLRVKKLTE